MLVRHPFGKLTGRHSHGSKSPLFLVKCHQYAINYWVSNGNSLFFLGSLQPRISHLKSPSSIHTHTQYTHILYIYIYTFVHMFFFSDCTRTHVPCVHIFTPTNVMSAAIIDCHDLRNCLQALLKCISRKVAKSFLATWHFLLVAVREKSATCIFSLFCREDLSFLVGGLLRSSSSIKMTSSIILGSVLPFKQGFSGWLGQRFVPCTCTWLEVGGKGMLLFLYR